ncbi:RNase H and/or RVT 3 domain containing protein [Asbolus verrucosus]|uniref:ribonuclease H n=1 Tax=Asbolus verrucosus TaxID=1661398 RepID=A0A482VYR6_ASBVE|nr:RNase H and/or RVT 3 domain containing protein [Asbolus verrucosus]
MAQEKDFFVVYAAGACKNNGKEDAKAGIGVYFLATGEEVTEIVKDVPVTNNIAELRACTRATEKAIENDSEYVVKCMNEWICKWKNNNWKTISTYNDVKNKDLIDDLGELCELIEVKWEHIPCCENMVADKLAKQAIAD